MKRIHVEVAGAAAAAKRFARAWHATKKGEPVEPVVAVGSIGELTALLSPKRMELLRFVAAHPGRSVRSLAHALGRDYKNVHTDVTELEDWQLLERDAARRVTTPYDEIVIHASLRQAA